MHQNTKANSLYVKAYLATNLILILNKYCTFSMSNISHLQLHSAAHHVGVGIPLSRTVGVTFCEVLSTWGEINFSNYKYMVGIS